MGFIVPPSKWEIQHAKPIFAAQKYQAAHGGQLPQTPMWRKLEFRHSLNSARFNFYHPNIGRMIEAQGGSPTPVQQVIDGWKGHMRGPTPEVVAPGEIIPPEIVVIPPPADTGGGSSVTPPPNPLSPQVVPEPTSILMFAGAVLVMGLGFHRSRRRPR